MFNECRHILTNGYKCKAAALRGKAFCYFHTAARRYADTRTTSADPIYFPSVEDVGGVQIALNQVFRNLGAHRLEPRHAGVYFYGLQIASKLVSKSKNAPAETVRDINEDQENGGSLAPEKSVCEPPADCIDCRRRTFCQKFEFDEDEVQELEDRLQEEQEGEQEAAEQEAQESATEEEQEGKEK
jgi:hypothetical protein